MRGFKRGTMIASHKPAVGVLGRNLRLARVEKRLTINELADMAGISGSQITGAENRRVLPNLPTMMAICQVLDCSIDWLCGLEDDNGRPLRPMPGEPLKTLTQVE